MIGSDAEHGQGGSEFGDKQKQHQNDEDAAFKQSIQHRIDACLYERRSVIKNIDVRFFRQAVLYFGKQLFYAGHHIL